MIFDDYRWQDHLSTPAKLRADLALAIVVLALLSMASVMSEAHDGSGSMGASDATSKQLLIGRAATTSRLELHDKISGRSGALQ
jgi:hypothetical protein